MRKEIEILEYQSRCYEGFPMAILEGAGYGKPVIAPDHGGFSEIIGKGDNAIGVLFEPGNTDALARAVTSLWNDPERIKTLGLKANQKLNRLYSTEVIAKKWATLLNSFNNC